MNNNIVYTIIIIGFILVIFYFMYNKYFLQSKSNMNQYGISLISDIKKFSEDFERIIPTNTLVTSRDTFYIPYLGYGISFSWEMYIPAQAGNYEWNSSFNRDKPIIKMNDSPVISYNPKKNYLSVTVKYRDNPYLTKLTELKYFNVKCQTWVKYIVVITQHNIILYENSKIVKVKDIPSPPILYDINSKLFLGEKNNNCLCKFKNLYIYPYSLNTNEILSI